MPDMKLHAKSQAALDAVAAHRRFPTAERVPLVLRIQTRLAPLTTIVAIGVTVWCLIGVLRRSGTIP